MEYTATRKALRDMADRIGALLKEKLPATGKEFHCEMELQHEGDLVMLANSTLYRLRYCEATFGSYTGDPESATNTIVEYIRGTKGELIETRSLPAVTLGAESIMVKVDGFLFRIVIAYNTSVLGATYTVDTLIGQPVEEKIGEQVQARREALADAKQNLLLTYFSLAAEMRHLLLDSGFNVESMRVELADMRRSLDIIERNY